MWTPSPKGIKCQSKNKLLLIYIPMLYLFVRNNMKGELKCFAKYAKENYV